MKKDDLKKEINNILNSKKVKDAIVVVLILAFLLIVVSFFYDTKKNQSKTTDGPVVDATDNKSNNTNLEDEKYEQKEIDDLETILKEMNGVGKVSVKMYFESGEVKVPAIDNDDQVSKSEETDTNGGVRHSQQNTTGSKVVMQTTDGNNELVILKTNKPTIVGILVAAQGAENSKVKYQIEMAITKLYGISSNKVNVYPMKS